MGLAMLGDKLPAAEAERMGLIWKCVDDDALMAEVEALAQRLAAMPTRALVSTREAIGAAAQMDYAAALAAEAGTQRELGFAHDYGEGVQAFFEKRGPNFTDR